MNKTKYLRILILGIGLAQGACSAGGASDEGKTSNKFEGSEDASALVPDQPIENKDVVGDEVVLAEDKIEGVKNEASQDLPTGNNPPPIGTPSPDQPAPPVAAPPAPAPAPAPPPAPAPFYPAQCAAIKKAQPTAASGSYKIYLNATDGARVAIDAYCDMSEDGGGWTLLLNYVHKGGTNPLPAVLSNKLPLLVSDTLGVDESTAVGAWGHASNAALKQFNPSELRFYCRSSAVARVVHFKTNDASCLAASTTGIGTCTGVKSSFSTLTGHTGNTPANVDRGATNGGEFALTSDVFGSNTFTYDAMWSIHGDTSETSWECDFGSNSSAADTIHRIYFR